MTLTIYKNAVIGLLVFNVILLVLSIININRFYTICMSV